jgi:hypothetical protein
MGELLLNMITVPYLGLVDKIHLPASLGACFDQFIG